MAKKILTELTETEIRQLFREELEQALATHGNARQGTKRRIVSFAEGCEHVSISTSHGYKLTSQGLIPHSKRGKRIYFDLDELDAWMLANKVKTVNDMQTEIDDYLKKNAKG